MHILTTDCYWANINTRFEIRSVDLAHLRLDLHLAFSMPGTTIELIV